MDSTNKSNVLKVFRVAILSNINYHSIEYILIGYKKQNICENFSSGFQYKYRFSAQRWTANKNFASKVPRVTINHIDLRKISSKYLRMYTHL